ncbi:MAG: LamG domain-containing protein [Candidatus Methylomirabilales bacterium]
MKTTSKTFKALLGVGLVPILVFTPAGQTVAQTCVQPPTGLVSWWPGDGDAMDIASQNNGTPQNGITFAAGEVEQAFSFDGNDDFVLVPDPSSGNLDFTGPFTIDAWIKLPDLSGIHEVVSKLDNTPNANSAAYELVVVNDELRGTVYDNSSCGAGGGCQTFISRRALKALSTGWNHVAMVYDGGITTSAIKLYVDGVKVDDTDLTSGTFGAIKDVTAHVMIGANTKADGNIGNFFDGLIDEVEIFARDLSQEEIQAIFDAGSAGKCTAGITKIIASGPDQPDALNGSGTSDGEIDVVVEIGQISTTEYDFDITYTNPGGPAVVILDTLPAEWQVKDVAGNTPDDAGFIEDKSDNNGGDGTVNVFPANKKRDKNKNKSATKIEWTLDPALNSSTINVVATTRQSPGKRNLKFKPTSCGPLFLNDGALVLELDPATGEPKRDPNTGEVLPPLFESEPLLLAAVKDVNGDGAIARDGSGDEDGDGLTDLAEVRDVGTDPCLADTDGDGAADGQDTHPLDPKGQ